MDGPRFDAVVKSLSGAGPRRQLLAGLLGAALAAPLRPGRAGATQGRLCCSAVCLDGVLCPPGHVVHGCFKLKDAATPYACPPSPAGYEATGCREVVPNCSDCGKTVCPARE